MELFRKLYGLKDGCVDLLLSHKKLVSVLYVSALIVLLYVMLYFFKELLILLMIG
jgi:hypothetical protein